MASPDDDANDDESSLSAEPDPTTVAGAAAAAVGDSSAGDLVAVDASHRWHHTMLPPPGLGGEDRLFGGNQVHQQQQQQQQHHHFHSLGSARWAPQRLGAGASGWDAQLAGGMGAGGGGWPAAGPATAGQLAAQAHADGPWDGQHEDTRSRASRRSGDGDGSILSLGHSAMGSAAAEGFAASAALQYSPTHAPYPSVPYPSMAGSHSLLPHPQQAAPVPGRGGIGLWLPPGQGSWNGSAVGGFSGAHSRGGGSAIAPSEGLDSLLQLDQPAVHGSVQLGAGSLGAARESASLRPEPGASMVGSHALRQALPHGAHGAPIFPAPGSSRWVAMDAGLMHLPQAHAAGSLASRDDLLSVAPVEDEPTLTRASSSRLVKHR